MATTKHKLEFVHAMARHTRATVRQCEALMRYAGTLQRISTQKTGSISPGKMNILSKGDRIRRKISLLCSEIRASEAFSLRYAISNIETNLTGKDYPHERWNSSLKYAKEALAGDYSDSALGDFCTPIFSGDPRGCVLKIRVPDGFSDDGNGGGNMRSELTRRFIRQSWRKIAVDEINRHPFNPRARYADERDRGEIVYFAAIAYRSQLNRLYAEAMRRKRTSPKLLEQIRDVGRNLASIGLYQLQEASR